jgi:hypothetical protein
MVLVYPMFQHIYKEAGGLSFAADIAWTVSITATHGK